MVTTYGAVKMWQLKLQAVPLNKSADKDGQERCTLPLVLPSYLFADSHQKQLTVSCDYYKLQTVKMCAEY